ncbi:MAG: OsmC family protein [Phycisphaerales bacterium]|nr:OsmC family protein [Phycisphaerales bacterium]
MPREARASIGTRRYETRVSVGPHGLVADEPGELGGDDRGPAPTELLLSAIAACKVITARMYADRKGWPVERIDAVARAAGASGHQITRIEVALEVVGGLTDEQRRRVLEVADKCPVQKAVRAGTVVVSRLA